MKAQVDDRIVGRLRAERDAAKVAELIRALVERIKSTEKPLGHSRSEYQLIPKEAVSELIRVREEVLTWQIRQRVLIEVWELLTGKVWDSGMRRG